MKALKQVHFQEFYRLSGKEVDDIGLFIDRFFAFKSLKAWQRSMDKLLTTIFSEGRLANYSRYSGDDSKIYRYLEKLTEACFFDLRHKSQSPCV